MEQKAKMSKEKNRLEPPSAVLNPLGFGMWFCLNAMDDCIESNDKKMYSQWLELGLKYAHKFLENSQSLSSFPMNTNCV